MALQQLTHGEPNWDVKVNALIAKVSENEGKIAALDSTAQTLRISDWSTAGIVIHGGFHMDTNSKGYRTINFPNGKLIEIDLKFSPSANTIKGLTQTAITLPDAIAANQFGMDAGFWADQKSVFVVRDWSSDITIYRIDNDSNDWWNSGFFVHVIYLKN